MLSPLKAKTSVKLIFPFSVFRQKVQYSGRIVSVVPTAVDCKIPGFLETIRFSLNELAKAVTFLSALSYSL